MNDPVVGVPLFENEIRIALAATEPVFNAERSVSSYESMRTSETVEKSCERYSVR